MGLPLPSKEQTMKIIIKILKAIFGFFRDAFKMLLYFFFPSFKPPKGPSEDIIDINM